MLVSLAVGSLLMLGVIGLMMLTEDSRRQTRGATDLDQVGNYLGSTLDRWLRNAGSGLSNVAANGYGCLLHASKSGTQLLPSGTPPAPFDAVVPGLAGRFRLAPVLIAAGQSATGVSGQASDVLIVMGSQAGLGGSAVTLAGPADSTSLPLASAQGFRANDLLLVIDPGSGSRGNCMVQQVSSGFVAGTTPSALDLPLGGAYQTATINSVELVKTALDSQVLNLGRASNGSAPVMALIGVGEHRTLYSYDLLATTSTPLQALAEGVFELHALYGIASTSGGGVDSWISPASGDYSITALSDGSAAATARLQRIKAVRLGLILRSAQPDNTTSTAAPSSLTLFTDLGTSLTHTRTLTSAERRYRYRTIELTVPLRNNLLLD